MDNFVQQIFEIDRESEEYRKLLENKKNELLQERKCQLEELDNLYLNALEEEKNNLHLKLTNIESQEWKELEKYKAMAENTKNLFVKKREILVENIAKSILEGGY
ncbi:MAG: hypothetical protein ACRDA4_02140 [Filifactoraceae bacterium]